MALVNGDTPGTVYLLHFDPPYEHARHYLGWTNRPEVRYEAHLNGRGSRLVAAAVNAGCSVRLVWSKPGTRREEARLKSTHDRTILCPECGAERRARKAAWLRAHRQRKREEREMVIW